MNEKTLATAAKLPLTIVHTSETILAGSGEVPDRETGGNEHVTTDQRHSPQTPWRRVTGFAAQAHMRREQDTRASHEITRHAVPQQLHRRHCQ